MIKLLLEFIDMRDTALEVLRGISPLLAIGFIFSLAPWVKKYNPAPPEFFSRLLKGGLMVFIGLTLFLQGVSTGFLPIGSDLGKFLALSAGGYPLIPCGLVLGFAICIAEPSVSVLCSQVEVATAGSIPRRLLLLTMCIGVAIATALGMTRLIFGWSLLWLILPGYALIIIMSRYCSDFFAAIAYDSSTVVTGPIVSAFLMSLALGAAEQLEGRDKMLDGFGLVTLIAMVPIITVMAVGVIYNYKLKQIEKQAAQNKKSRKD